MCRHVCGGSFGNRKGRGNIVPNWVYNTMWVRGSKQRLNEFRNRARQGTPWDDEDRFVSELSFWNFVRPSDDILHEYRLGEPLPFDNNDVNNWYNWNVRNWGTKWDAGRVSVEDDGDADALIYDFETAWAAPIPVFEIMAREYPDLTFTFRWEEEQGFGEELWVKVGALVTVDKWDESRMDIIV